MGDSSSSGSHRTGLLSPVCDERGLQIGRIDGARPGVFRTFQLQEDPNADERTHLGSATLRVLVNVSETDGISDRFAKSVPLLVWDTETGWDNDADVGAERPV